MNGVLLRFYVLESDRHHHVALHDWLREEGRRLGARGGSAFRALASFGRHGVLREEHFFELPGTLGIAVEFALSEAEADALVEAVARAGLAIPYVKVPAHFAVTGR